ncbi:MAG: hypothetical protein ACRCTY_09410 [Candidatus Adiutrix sp.]
MGTLNLDTLDTYKDSCLKLMNHEFKGLNVADIIALEEGYNAYPALANLQPPKQLTLLEDAIIDSTVGTAKKAILNGQILWEHTAAGEGTRLNLGPKFFLHPHSESVLAALAEIDSDSTSKEGETVNPQTLLPLTLGQRHLWQKVFEITNLAQEAGLDPNLVLSRQKMLLIVAEDTYEAVRADLIKQNFFGLKAENCLLMVQSPFRGLSKVGPNWAFDRETPLRLHNHGQMGMQKTMDKQIFHLMENGQVRHLSRVQFFETLDLVLDLVSYNIEDLGYLTKALDFVTIGLAIQLGQKGYGMTMEIVPNNPHNPVKGGLCAHDPSLARDVVIESFRLKGLEPKDIGYLNKNFNHYPNPGSLFRKLNREGLFMPLSVKDGAVYFQPVQGDLNFLTECAFITRKKPETLCSWKLRQDIPAAFLSMAAQDRQPGFAQMAKKI